MVRVSWEGLEDDEVLRRTISFPEEDRHLFTTMPWGGGYRWFKTENVVCLDRYRSRIDMARICDRILAK
jgi:hypothetical protein